MRLNHQTVGNVGLYWTCYRLSLLGWNVMPTARNARGIDLIAYSQDATRTFTVQVKSLSKKNPVPLGKGLDHLFADYLVICCNVTRDRPDCFILTPTEAKQLVHRGIKDEKVSFWLQPKGYGREEYCERWERIGTGDVLGHEPPLVALPTLAVPPPAVSDVGTTATEVAVQRATPPGTRTNEFRSVLTSLLAEAERNGATQLEVNAGQLHRQVGGYPGPKHRMPSCCDAMRAAMQDGDVIMTEPPKGRGASLTIRYSLPRLRAVM